MARKSFDHRFMIDYNKRVKRVSKDIEAFENIEKQIKQLMAIRDPKNLNEIYEENKNKDSIWSKNDYVYNTMTKMIKESIASGKPIVSTYIDDLISMKELERQGLFYKIDKQVKFVEAMRKRLNGYPYPTIERWKEKKLDNIKDKSYQLKDVKNKGLVGKLKENRDKYKLIKNITKMEYQRSRSKSLEKINQLSDGTELTPRQRRKIILLYKVLHSSIPVATFKGAYRGIKKSNENLKTYNRRRRNSKEYNKRVAKMERRRSMEVER